MYLNAVPSDFSGAGFDEVGLRASRASDLSRDPGL